MAETVENLVLELPRAIRGDIARISGRMDEHGHRLASIKLAVAGQRREQAHDAETGAGMGVRYDELAERLDRVERRPGLAEAEL